MKITTRLLFIAALFALVLPLMFMGNASAVVYNPDGLTLNGTTGMWELPVFGSAGIAGCYDGTTTINDTPVPYSRFTCYNIAVPSRTTQSACITAGTTPAGWNAAAAIGRWSACSKGGYSANTTNSLTDCATNGGTVNAFTRCNRAPQGADCTSIPGYTFVSAGSDAASYTCKTTGMTEPQCTAFTATTGLGYNVIGSAGVVGAVVTCSIYVGNDAPGCTALGGTISTTNIDETRGYCGANWVFKAGTTGDWGSSVRNNCTKCHNPSYMASAGTDFENFDGELIHSVRDAGTVSQYMNASHKNASRKIEAGKSLVNAWIDTAGVEHFGIFPYVPGGFSGAEANQVRRIDWVNGKIEDTTGGLKNLPTGVYTEWYWEFGYYGEDPERGVFNAEAGTNGKPIAKLPACFACHATNYQNNAAGVAFTSADITKEPAKSLGAGIYWNGTTTYTPGTRPGVVNFVTAMTNRQTNVKTTGTYGNWDEMGVVCSRCHNAAGGSHTGGGVGAPNPASPPAGQSVGTMVNAVCGQCHVRAGSGDYAVTAGTGALAVRAAVGTGHPNWHETDYLNSPHARFTGTYAQINQTSQYNSAFMTSFNGCVGCHNPHGSVRGIFEELAIEEDPHGTDESLGPLEGVEEGCVDCHNVPRGSAPAITSFRHPTDPTKPTPWATPDPCATCHMAGGRHLFRVTTDVNYTTTQATAFPVKAETYPSGTWNDAVWQDLKSVCQQCHNGHTEGIPFIQTADLRGFANGFHGGTPSPEAFPMNLHYTKTNLHVDFDAVTTLPNIGNGCPTGDTCSYKWDFGDGATLTTAGSSTSHNYAAKGSYSAQVIVVDTTASTNAAKAQSFTLASGNTAPVAAATMSQSGWAVSITNTSTDAETATANLGVTIKCGNGTTASGTGVGPFTCTYTTQGSYILKMTVTDAGGLKSTINMQATVPVKYSVSGSVMRLNGTTPVPSASVRLMVGTQVVKMAATAANGTFTLTSVNPGSYTLRVVKSGLVFVDQPVVVTNANVTGITVLADR